MTVEQESDECPSLHTCQIVIIRNEDLEKEQRVIAAAINMKIILIICPHFGLHKLFIIFVYFSLE